MPNLTDDYLSGLAAPRREALQRVRNVIKTTVPDATETISYGMPAFKYKGKYLVGFSNFKYHLSIFPGSQAVEELQSKLSGFTTSKGTIQFTLEHELPEELIAEIVLHRKHAIDT